MRGRELLYPNIRLDSNRPSPASRSPLLGNNTVPEAIQTAVFIAYPTGNRDHWYVHRLGQSQGCELRGLAERDGPGSSTVHRGMGALGASISSLRAMRRRLRARAGERGNPAPNSPIGRCGKVQVI